MKIKTISIEPISGFDRDTGNKRLAKVQVFIPDLQMTIRDIVLMHDHGTGYTVKAVKPKTGRAPVLWVVGSPFANAIAEAAAEAYSVMLAEDIEDLRRLYDAA